MQIYWIESLRGSFIQGSVQPKGQGMGVPKMAGEEDCIYLFSLLRALRTKRPLSCKRLNSIFWHDEKSQNTELTLFPSALKIKLKQRH